MCRYNYNRDDEEVYKEFLEIANEMIPNVMRMSSGDQCAGTAADVLPPANDSVDKLPLTSDPDCYAMVLQFYDGMCEWEEGSSTPVLHITWAQHALYSLGRFDFKARANLTLRSATTPLDDIDSKSDNSAVSSHSAKLKLVSDTAQRGSHRARGRVMKTVSPASPVDDGKSLSDENANQASPASVLPVTDNTEDKHNTVASEISVEQTVNEKSTPLAAECSTDAAEAETSAGAEAVAIDKCEDTDTIQAYLVLRSEKMMGMKDLLVAERLNSGAIKLQLTAQSQVHLKHSRTAAATDYVASDVTASSASRKRIRRE